MSSVEIICAACRLSLGALAAFFAIVLWSKTRDAAWMLVVGGVLTLYVETVYSVLQMLGIADSMLENVPGLNSLRVSVAPFVSLVLSCLPMLFFAAAFIIMALRNFKNRL